MGGFLCDDDMYKISYCQLPRLHHPRRQSSCLSFGHRQSSSFSHRLIHTTARQTGPGNLQDRIADMKVCTHWQVEIHPCDENIAAREGGIELFAAEFLRNCSEPLGRDKCHLPVGFAGAISCETRRCISKYFGRECHRRFFLRAHTDPLDCRFHRVKVRRVTGAACPERSRRGLRVAGNGMRDAGNTTCNTQLRNT